MRTAAEIRDWTMHRCAEAQMLHGVLSREIEQLSQDAPGALLADVQAPLERKSPLHEVRTSAAQLALAIDTFNYVLEFIDSESPSVTGFLSSRSPAMAEALVALAP